MQEQGADRRKSRQMKLGLMLQQSGHHIASWLHPEAWVDTELDFSKLVRLVKMAEEGLFDFVFEADSLSGEKFTPDTLPRTAIGVRIDPMTLLTALAAVTEHIGLVCTATTTYDQPYLVARRFASLDQLSGGRGGWNVVTSAHAPEARNFGGAAHPDKLLRKGGARPGDRLVLQTDHLGQEAEQVVYGQQLLVVLGADLVGDAFRVVQFVLVKSMFQLKLLRLVVTLPRMQ